MADHSPDLAKKIDSGQATEIAALRKLLTQLP
jgi:hypothetical protein